MSRGNNLVSNAIDGVFLPRSPMPHLFVMAKCFTYDAYRGVPTSFYSLNMMFLINRGTSQFCCPFNTKKTLFIYLYIDINVCMYVCTYVRTYVRT